MKVLFSITYYHPYVSGLTIAASRWAEGLEKEGHEVTVLCLFGAGKRVIRARSLFTISKGFFSIDWFFQSWQQVKNHDVIVVNLPQFEGVIPAFFGKLMGKKIIAIYHCEVVLPPGFFNSIVQSLLEVSNMATLLMADRVITYTSDYVNSSRVLRSLRLPRSPKMKYIVPPIPKPSVNSAFVQKFKKLIGKSGIVIGVAARLAAEKGIEYLLEALPQIQVKSQKSKVKIVVAGPMDPVREEAYKEKIMSLVKKYHKRVIFLGEISPREMGSFYRCIDVLVVPSVNRTEAFGLVQVEAMLCGVPVVASDLPGVRVPVKKTGMGIVVPPGDSKKLAEAISMIINNKVKYKKDISNFLRCYANNRLFTDLF